VREECYRALPPTPPGHTSEGHAATNCNTPLAHVAVALSVCVFEHLSMMNRDHLLCWDVVDVRVSVCRWHTLSLRCRYVCMIISV